MMNTKTTVLLVFVLLATCGCRTGAETAALTQDQAMERLWNQPEVREAANEIRQLDKQASIMILGNGEQTISGRDFYVLQLAESKEDHLATIAWAAIDKHTGEVFFSDPATDELLTPAEWKRHRNKSAAAPPK